MHFTTKAAATLAIASTVPGAFGHYIFDKLILNGAPTAQWEYVRKLASSQSNSPIFDVTSNDIRCMPLDASATTKTAPVTAGDTVGFTVNSNMGHPGPLTVYMSKAPGAIASYTGDGDWFKIMDAGVKTFASQGQQLTWITDGVTQVDFTIPTAIENGDYLLRVEHIATHEAGRVGGAQFYISCAQITVSGGSGGTPSPVGKFPGIYTATDPGIQFEPYYPFVTAYTLPGLAVYGGGASGNADGSGKAGGAGGAPAAPAPSRSVTAAPTASFSRAAATSAPATTLATSIVAPVRPITSVAAGASPVVPAVPSASASGKVCRQKKRRAVKDVRPLY